MFTDFAAFGGQMFVAAHNPDGSRLLRPLPPGLVPTAEPEPMAPVVEEPKLLPVEVKVPHFLTPPTEKKTSVLVVRIKPRTRIPGVWGGTSWPIERKARRYA